MLKLLLANLRLAHLIKNKLTGGEGHVVTSEYLSTMLSSQPGTVLASLKRHKMGEQWICGDSAGKNFGTLEYAGSARTSGFGLENSLPILIPVLGGGPFLG